MSGGKLRELRGRIRAVEDILQTTTAMKLVSAAKLRRAQDAILAARPYNSALQEIVGRVILAIGEEEDATEGMPLARVREVKRVCVVLITSHRGLCGAFNTSLIKRATEHIEKLAGEFSLGDDAFTVVCVGKRGWKHFVKLGRFRVVDEYLDVVEALTFEGCVKFADYLMDGFLRGEFDRVDVVYAHFRNPAVQKFTVEQILPVVPRATAEQSASYQPDYIFEPDKRELLSQLLPFIVRTNLYTIFLDARASEHGARMTAMDKASDNAKKRIQELRLLYNKARQEHITRELVDIATAARALSGE